MLNVISKPANSHGCERRRQLGDPEEVDPTAAAREVLEALENRGHRDRDRERCQREIEAREAGGREPEENARCPGDEDRDRDRDDVLDPVIGHQDRGGVPTDRHEGAVAERDLPRVAGQDVQPRQRHEVDPDVGELLCAEVVHERGQRVHGDGQHGEREQGTDSGTAHHG